MAEKMYGSFNDEHSDEGSVAFSIAKVFGHMFVGLLITAVIALGLGALFQYLIFGNFSANPLDNNVTYANGNAATGLMVLLIASSIGIIIFSIALPLTAFKGAHNVKPLFIVYCILMGVMLSSIAVFVPWYILGTAFLATSLIFGLMALLGLISKGNMNGLAIVAMGLVMGAGLLSLVSWIEMLFFANVNPVIFWIMNLALFAAIMLITIVDVARIKKICQDGMMNENLSLYCAFVLYNDFIYIFLRVLRVVIVVMGNKK